MPCKIFSLPNSPCQRKRRQCKPQSLMPGFINRDYSQIRHITSVLCSSSMLGLRNRRINTGLIWGGTSTSVLSHFGPQDRTAHQKDRSAPRNITRTMFWNWWQCMKEELDTHRNNLREGVDFGKFVEFDNRVWAHVFVVYSFRRILKVRLCKWEKRCVSSYTAITATIQTIQN